MVLQWEHPGGGIESNLQPRDTMMTLALILPVAAAGWAFLYWLCGGGLGGAFVIFVVLKLLGK